MSEIEPSTGEALQSNASLSFVEGPLVKEDIAFVPSTEADLYRFYREVVKRLYSVTQSENALPAEVLFEIHAAFEHLSRIYVLNADREYEVRKAYAHLKRSCLDIYKIYFRDTLDMLDELRLVDTSVIDNGQFDFDLKSLLGRTRKLAADARASEGDKNGEEEGKVLAFDLWQEVAINCNTLREQYYYSPNVCWAKRIESEKERKLRTKNIQIAIVTGLVTGLITGVVANFIYQFLARK